MCQRKSLGLQEHLRPESSFFPSLSSQSNPIRHTVALGRGRRFLVTRLLVIGAACLAAVLITGIALEAFASDLDLGPFGTEDFTLAAQGSSSTDIQPYQGCASRNSIPCCVMTADAHLRVQHGAGGAVAAGSPSILLAFNVAEPREQNLQAPLPLGHFFVGSRLTTDLCPSLRRVAARISVPS